MVEQGVAEVEQQSVGEVTHHRFGSEYDFGNDKVRVTGFTQDSQRRRVCEWIATSNASYDEWRGGLVSGWELKVAIWHISLGSTERERIIQDIESEVRLGMVGENLELEVEDIDYKGNDRIFGNVRVRGSVAGLNGFGGIRFSALCAAPYGRLMRLERRGLPQNWRISWLESNEMLDSLQRRALRLKLVKSLGQIFEPREA